MKNALQAEWIKLRTITSTKVLVIVSIVLTIGFAVLFAFVTKGASGRKGGDDGPPSTVSAMLAGVEFATFLLGVVAVLVATGDFRFTIRQTFAADPKRLRVLAAKALVVTVVSAVAGAVMVAVALGLSSAILRSRSLHLDFSNQGKSNAVGVVLYLVLFSLAGVALGHIIRHSAGAIVTLILWPLLLESIVGALAHNYFKWMERWLPFSAGRRLVNFQDDTNLFGRWTGGFYFAGFVAVLLALAAFFTNHRDA
jgi:ABC-2 type transport system permease protein